jgi:hypothetical protein
MGFALIVRPLFSRYLCPSFTRSHLVYFCSGGDCYLPTNMLLGNGLDKGFDYVIDLSRFQFRAPGPGLPLCGLKKCYGSRITSELYESD